MPHAKFDLSNITGHVVLIPAAGVGMRCGGDIAKQYQEIKGKKILDITLELFLANEIIEKIILLISPNDTEYEKLDNIDNDKIVIVDGGEERQISVHNGLKYLYDNGLPYLSPVLVHDAVRPCLAPKDLTRLIKYYQQHKRACFLADPVTDSIKKITQDGRVLKNVERADLVTALTPQMTTFIELKKSLSQIIKSGIVVTDEVGALTDCDIEVFAVFAEELNPKITLAKDIKLAEQILASR